MGQQPETDAWTTPVYNLSSRANEDESDYEYELIEVYGDNYLQLYSSKEYRIEMLEIETRTEPQTRIDVLNDTFDLEKRKYQP